MFKSFKCVCYTFKTLWMSIYLTFLFLYFNLSKINISVLILCDIFLFFTDYVNPIVYKMKRLLAEPEFEQSSFIT